VRRIDRVGVKGTEERFNLNDFAAMLNYNSAQYPLGMTSYGSEKAEAIEMARAAQIESGDLLVTKTHEYEKATKDTLSKQRAENILKALEGATEPILVRELAENLKAYYEEVLPALTMLEALGKVQRYEALAAGRGRRQVAYMLVD